MRARHAESSCVVDEEGRAANLLSVLRRGLPSIGRYPAHDGELAIVGSGPSVRDYLGEIRRWRGEIWAINGAYDYLVSQGIVPDAFVGMDPLPGLAQYVQHIDKRTTCYLASICDPGVFDALTERKVVLWHPEAEGMIERYPRGSLIVGGGTHVMTRAPYVARALGWRDKTLFGCDSSYDTEIGPYCYEWGSYGCDIDSKPFWVKTPDGRGPFLTELGMAKQVSQLLVLHQAFNGMIKIRCGGLMSAMLQSPTFDDSKIEVVKDEQVPVYG